MIELPNCCIEPPAYAARDGREAAVPERAPAAAQAHVGEEVVDPMACIYTGGDG